MPVYAEDHPALPSPPQSLVPPLLRQVLDWIGQPDQSKSKPGEESESDHLVSNRLFFHLLQEEEEEDGRRRMASSALASVAPPKCPYSAVAKNPAVPYVFQMPLHYPRFTKMEYEQMPEWQLDRLFEEYGLSALISEPLRDKRDYAIGAFIWK